MLALRFYGRRDIRLEEVPTPKVKEDEVLVEVTDAGISQTQINEFVEGPFIIQKTPLIPSQEYGGIVDGELVAVLPLLSCKKCEYCLNKKEHLCDNIEYYGLIGEDGGFCEYSAVKKDNIFKVKKRELITFVEPILVAIHAARKLNLDNKRVLVLGAGAIGVSVASVIRDYFKADVLINDILYPRMDRAKAAGLEVIEKEKIKDKFDIVIDAAGMDTLISKPALNEAFERVKKGGVVLNIGTYFHSLSFIPSNLLIQEVSLIESFAYNLSDVEILNDVLDSLKIDFSKLIEYIRLKDIIEDGYFRAEIDKESFTRIVVEP